jgi:hypothetical protein
MSNRPTYPAPRKTRSNLADSTPRSYTLDDLSDIPSPLICDCFVDENRFVDDPDFADGFGLPINSLTEDDLRYLRDFILSSAMYVEQLEAFLCDSSDDFWEARELAYRIITALLIRHYEYELEG